MNPIIYIDSLSHPDLAVYTINNEVQLLRYNEPAPGLFIAESPKVIMRAIAAGYEPISFLLEEKHLQGEGSELFSKFPEVPLYVGTLETLTQLTGFSLTRGMLCAMQRKTLPTVSEICKSATRIAILENVVNPTNVGAIFRSAAAMHIDAVLLTPGCADPLYRRASRVSMGTVFQIPWTYIGKKNAEWYADGLTQIKELGFKTAALALKEDSISIDDPRLALEAKLAILLGTEGDGLNTSTIADCDYTVLIPMSHDVDSLNVAAASAVAFWQLGNRNVLHPLLSDENEQS